jgi:hypothetical protein
LLGQRHKGWGTQGEFRVQRYRPLRRRIFTVAVFAAVGVLGWGCFQLGAKLSGYSHERAQAQLGDLRQHVAELEAENARLLVHSAHLQRSIQIEQQAASQDRKALIGLQTRVMALNEELSFYKSIVSPSDMGSGLHIQDFRLRRGEGPGEFWYELVLIQARGNHQVARGKVGLEIEGQRGNVSGRLSLAELNKNKPTFAFTYFQTIEGRLLVPQGFKPHSVYIQVEPDSEHLQPIERRLAWQEALIEGA